jgi:hypothetical protein
MKKILVLIFLSCFNLIAIAQNPFEKLKNLKIKNLPNVNNLLKGKDPITTSLDDAVTEAPELDNFEPTVILPGSELPRNADGSFYIFPGVWEFHLKSYCMKAGTYGPSKTSGSGHVYAPLKGPKADVIQSLLKNGFKHPEVKQREIQVLIWAIIARQNLKDMPKEYMLTAAKLLDANQLIKLNDGIIKNLAQKELSKSIESLPEPVQEVLEAENKMRGMLVEATTKYEDLEKVAVLNGIMPEDEGRKVKKGRWSLTPDGYYIRYFPSSYSNMILQVYVKENAYTTFNYVNLKNANSKCGASIFSLNIPYLKIKEFDPSKHPGLPPGRGQRLGPSNDKRSPDDRDDALDKANKILNGADNALTGFGLATDPLGAFVDKGNPFSPGNMFGHILNFITDNGRKISNALNGDPPDPNYKEFAKPESYNYKGLKQTAFKNKELNQLSIDFVHSYLETHALMLALAQTNDKQGGAKLANDELWINKQAQAVIYYKKKVGEALQETCDKWENYLKALKAQVKTTIPIKVENIKAYQEKLRSNGFSKEELETFQFLRMNTNEIENVKKARLQYNPTQFSGDYFTASQTILQAWKAYATTYSKFPSIPAPWE